MECWAVGRKNDTRKVQDCLQSNESVAVLLSIREKQNSDDDEGEKKETIKKII